MFECVVGGFGGGFGDSGDLVGRLFWCFGLGVRCLLGWFVVWVFGWVLLFTCDFGCLAAAGYVCIMVSCDGCRW